MRQGLRGLLAAILVSGIAPGADAQPYDPELAWPLCGRISESPPNGWNDSKGCPANRWGNPAHSDAPFSSTFGPRPLGSENDRFDFHRGVDIATPTGTPIFAVTEGSVEIAGANAGYSDPLIKLRHFRPGAASCSSGGGCYHSYYLHISDWLVAEDDWVEKGQLIGYTGASGASGFQHLHFELRDAPAFDPFSAWSRDAVHPFGPLPYAADNDTQVSFTTVDASDPQAVRAGVTVQSNRYDLVSVEMAVFDAQGAEVPQSGAVPDANGYHVLPPFYDLETWNFEYSHKDSAAYPWSSFGQGGAHECPYHADHGPSYSAHVHLDAQDPGDAQRGLFNGVGVATTKYWLQGNRDYWLELEFRALTGPAACIEATAVFSSGDTSSVTWGSCGGGPPPPAIDLVLSTNKKRNQVQLSWSGASGNKVDIYRDGSRFTTTRNDGGWNDRAVSRGESHTYQVCEQGSTTACSAEASITL